MTEADFTEVMEESKNNLIPLPEAPSSANVKLWIGGFGVMFTFRGTDDKEVLERLLKFVKGAAEQGWKPSWKEEGQAVPPTLTNDDVPEGAETCPIHNVKMFKKDGQYGPFWTHGNKREDGSWENCSGKGYK